MKKARNTPPFFSVCFRFVQVYWLRRCFSRSVSKSNNLQRKSIAAIRTILTNISLSLSFLLFFTYLQIFSCKNSKTIAQWVEIAMRLKIRFQCKNSLRKRPNVEFRLRSKSYLRTSPAKLQLSLISIVNVTASYKYQQFSINLIQNGRRLCNRH